MARLRIKKLLIFTVLAISFSSCMKSKYNNGKSNEKVLTCYDAFGNVTFTDIAVGNVSFDSFNNTYSFYSKSQSRVMSVQGPCSSI